MIELFDSFCHLDQRLVIEATGTVNDEDFMLVGPISKRRIMAIVFALPRWIVQSRKQGGQSATLQARMCLSLTLSHLF